MDFSSINHNSAEPVYIQIRRIILSAIRDNMIAPPESIPSITELCSLTRASRMTVYKSIQSLIQEGWLYTVPGKGIFISEGLHLEQNLQHLMGWGEEIRSQGLEPSTQLIQADVISAGPRIAGYLDLPVETKVVRITRLRFANACPISLETSHLSYEAFPGLGELIRVNASLYKLLREHYHVYLNRATQSLQAGSVDAQDADWLKLPVGEPVLKSRRIAYQRETQPVEYVRGIHHSRFISFKSELTIGSSTTRKPTEEMTVHNIPSDHEQ